MAEQLATGRVLQVNVSAGGVPKLPIERAWVGRFGLEGDGHHEPTVHGGPHRAVCLFGIEAIERLQSEGHPIEPGGAGENLTTSGIEWSLLPIGTRARIGDQVELELASSTTPCSTQKPNFSDGRFSRISIDLHPSDSRMYARVVTEGEVHPGDVIAVLAPPSDSRAADELILKRLDRAETKSSVAAWLAAREAGFSVDVVEDGELAMSASSDLPGPAFNHASGLAGLPNLLALVTDFYDARGASGWLMMDQAPWPQAKASRLLDVFAGDPPSIAHEATVNGVVVRRIGPDETIDYSAMESSGGHVGGVGEGGPNPWPAVYQRLAATRSRLMFVAEMDGEPVANASVHLSGHTGWLRGALVAPRARGLGIQRALVAARVQAAIEAGCDLVGAGAKPGDVSARNLERMGLRRVGQRTQYEYDPRAARK